MAFLGVMCRGAAPAERPARMILMRGVRVRQGAGGVPLLRRIVRIRAGPGRMLPKR
ncbi:hypothetical protein [Burkholderia pyrrocinia]|uniref:hypothetical protein n=1 Tax=Burkholderia pyrrocinia TaxID=60550 RepID=UPI001374A839|nr:hypothetical protein [Burkholderia pyrrocinia]